VHAVISLAPVFVAAAGSPAISIKQYVSKIPGNVSVANPAAAGQGYIACGELLTAAIQHVITVAAH
jgi:hypothetical protein